MAEEDEQRQIDPAVSFQKLVDIRSHELTLRWVRITLLAGLHSAYASYVVMQHEVGTSIHILLCVIGSITGLLSAYIIQRTRAWADYWISCLENGEETIPHYVPIFTGDTYRQQRSGIRVHIVVYYVVVNIVAIGWFVFGLYSYWRFL